MEQHALMAQEVAFQRMIQAGSQPITLISMLTEWIRDWGTTPYTLSKRIET
jgi:hypothetical protein